MKMMTRRNGSSSPSPSEAYISVLKGQDHANQYAEQVKPDVNRQLGVRPGSQRVARRAAG
jgi:hypothetical protein